MMAILAILCIPGAADTVADISGIALFAQSVAHEAADTGAADVREDGQSGAAEQSRDNVSPKDGAESDRADEQSVTDDRNVRPDGDASETERIERLEQMEREIRELRKAEIERIEKEKAGRKKKEQEKADRERTKQARAEKTHTTRPGLSVVDLSTKEYLALFMGYAGFFPVADYGAQYSPASMVWGTVGAYIVNFVGLSPELHVRYTPMSSREDPLRYNSSISLVQFFPAIIYRYHFRLPKNTLTVYGRVWDGLSRVEYSSRNPYLPLIKENIVENLNIFGLSAGCYYDVWNGLLVGIDFSYSIVSTAGKPLQGVSLMLNVGWRIL